MRTQGRDGGDPTENTHGVAQGMEKSGQRWTPGLHEGQSDR